MKHHRLVASTAFTRPIAYATMAPIPYGSGDYNLASILIVAAEVAAAQNETVEVVKLDDRDADSEYMLPYWNKTDDIVSGYDTIKARGTTYLPKFRHEDQDDYNERLGLTEFTNVYRDIVETLAVKPFEEKVALVEGEGDNKKTIPDKISEFIENVDGAKNNLTVFSTNVFYNAINSAIHWIYVDYPKVDRNVIRTQADEQNAGIRPFWSHVLARNVLEAKLEVIDGAETLVRMRIWEPGSPNHVRVFQRTTKINDRNQVVPQVIWALFQEIPAQGGEKQRRFILVDQGEITIGVIPLVPFILGRRDGRSFKLDPPMRDAADLQIQLYQQESGLKFAKTMTAYPMLAANGIKAPKGPDGKPQKLAIGPSRVLYSEPDGSGNTGSWAYVEPSAESLKFLKDDIKETMDQLRELGRQPLTAQSGNLTVVTTAVAAGKSSSAVALWAGLLEDALENALVLTAMWLNIKKETYDPDVNVYKEFDDFSGEQGSDLSSIDGARTRRDLSYKNWIKEMKRRKILRADLDPDENQKELLEETPIDDGSTPNDPEDKGNPGARPKPQLVKNGKAG